MLTGTAFCSILSYLYPANIPLVGSISMILSIVVVPTVSAFTQKLPSHHVQFIFNEQSATPVSNASEQPITSK
jgi:hypothetical protein